ncbi:MBL fold metallo-hydrolase [Streptomyces sp. NPDC041068]|uniref:MBL fold metallo-hydrolase n=1 Tax=Streptomyces sp. NPDC041068 TaxID=3155130 RepID=UPI0033C39381
MTTQWHEVGAGVFQRRYEPCDVTVTAIVGSAGVAVVDTRCSLAEAQEMKKDIARFASVPVRWVVNTHSHLDHTWGNIAFAAPHHSPPAQIWAHESVPAALTPDDPAVDFFLDTFTDRGPAWQDKVDRLEIVRPTHLVERTSVIDLGDRTMELRWTGRAHTAGDLWAVVPDADVVVAGDLIEEAGPPIWGPDSFPFEWPRTLDAAGAFLGAGTTVIPGHGAPVDADFVRKQRDLIASVAEQIRALHTAGVPLEEAPSAGTWPMPESRTTHAIARGYAALDRHTEPTPSLSTEGPR